MRRLFRAAFVLGLALPFGPVAGEPLPSGLRFAQADPESADAPPRAAPAQRRPEPARRPAAAKPLSGSTVRPPAAPAPSAAAPAPAPAAASAAAAPLELQPVTHARNAGMAPQCLDAVARAAAAAVDAPHLAVSTWSTGAADQHLFESIVTLTGPDGKSVRGAAVLTAGPTRGGTGCESSTVQVYPSARTCAAIRVDLLKGGRVVADAAGVPLIVSAAGSRNLLLPTGGGGCVIVAVTLAKE